MTWPSFIAAPFIVPRAATICSAVSMWRRCSATSPASSERARLAILVPRCLTACRAARPDTFAVRAVRLVGMRSLAIPRETTARRPPGSRWAAVGPARPSRYALPPSAGLIWEPGTMSSRPSGQRTHAL